MSKNDAIETLQDKAGLYEAMIRNHENRILDLTFELAGECSKLAERQKNVAEIYAALKALRKAGTS